MKEPECVLTKLVREEFQSLMGIVAEPRFATVHRWPRSMPQYVVGHQRRCDEIAAIVSELPGLHICGNAYSGVGIPDCVRLARQVASNINAN
jgi:oxygen-dependent protoporphyrinogen oxidase